MNYKGFRIENTPAFYCWGSHAGHNHVACWYVYNADGKRLAGGYDSGNNTRSGSADFPRRKEAKAWVDGYLAYHDEPENRKVLPNGFVVHALEYCSPRPTRDREEHASFEAGYAVAADQAARAAKVTALTEKEPTP